MTVIYRLSAKRQPRPTDPLHVGNFYSKERLHREAMQERQDLILYLAKLHSAASAKRRPRAFSTIKLRLTSLRDWVYDYRPALDHFFEVQQLGYHLGDDKSEVSILIPKDLGTQALPDAYHLEYAPPPRPDDGSISKVVIQQGNGPGIIQRLMDTSRFDLIEAVRWVLRHEELNFIFKPAGRLRQRDTSVWPVAGVETWPAWLREALFGPGIDIDSAYTQYLMQHLQVAYADRPHLLATLFPDLVSLTNDKQTWRRDLCEKVLGLPWCDDSISLVKKVCMSLANGSRISPGIMTGGQCYSVTADIIVRASADISPVRLEVIGKRLQHISKQYSHAKKVICSTDLRLNPSLRNQKRVFASYFEWEREARYLLWEAVDRHGIMVHDGIDGVPERYLQDLPTIIERVGVRVTT